MLLLKIPGLGLDIASILLGLIAWILPLYHLSSSKKSDLSLAQNTFLSFSACSVSLVLQFFHIATTVKNGDWSTLMDTSNTLALVAAIFVLVTIILNLISYRASKKISCSQSNV